MFRPTHELASIMFSTGDGPRFASADAGIARAEDVLRPVTLFSGVPKFRGAEAVLFDSLRKQDAERLPEVAIVRKLVLTFPDGTADLKDLDPDLSLLIYVGDLSSPRAEVHLADIVRRRGERPLNLRRWPGEVVRVILSDPAGAWGKGAPKIEVTFSW